MGMRFRKSVNLGPLRFTLSKSGISSSVGVKGFRVTKTASGRVRTTASIPGTGISYVKEASSANMPASARKRNRTVSQPEEASSATFGIGRRSWIVPVIGIAVLVFCILFSAIRSQEAKEPSKILNTNDLVSAAPGSSSQLDTLPAQSVPVTEPPTSVPENAVDILPLNEENLKTDEALNDPADKSIPAGTKGASSTTEKAEAEQTYVLNTNTMRFHWPSCKSAGKISEKNKATITSTRSDLIRQGYSPCSNCNP